MRLQLHNTRDARLARVLRRTARRIDQTLGLGPGTVTVVFTDDQNIRVLNRRWRGKDRATDVLSFRLDAREPGLPPLLGEIYVSVERARVQARSAGITLNTELERLVRHGLLHLAGLSHRQMKPYERWRWR